MNSKTEQICKMYFLIAGLVLLLSVSVYSQLLPPFGPELIISCARDKDNVSYNERSTDICRSWKIHILLRLLQLAFSCESKAWNLRATDLKLNFFVQNELRHYSIDGTNGCTCAKGNHACTKMMTQRWVNQYTLPLLWKNITCHVTVLVTSQSSIH